MPFDFFGAHKKVVIAMAHIGALPGTPLYRPERRHDAKLIDDVARDVESLQAGGVDAIMFGNENDRPYRFKAPPEGVAAMTAVVTALKPHAQGPVRRQLSLGPGRQRRHRLRDRRRLRARDLHRRVRLRHGVCGSPTPRTRSSFARDLGRPDLKLLFNINAEFAYSLDARPIELRAKSAVFSSLADAILVSGPLTGHPVETSDLKRRCARPSATFPSSPTPASTSTMSATFSPLPTACVIGTHFKVDGDTWNAGRSRRA